MIDSLTPQERTLRARLAAHALHASRDPRETTAAARRAGPGGIDYWIARVDPDGALPEAERLRRAASAKQAHFTRLAFASAKARRRGGKA